MLITLNKKTHGEAFTLAAWVAAAISKDPTKEYLQHVKYTGSELVATDGHRLHKAEIDLQAPAGLYQVLKSTRTDLILALNENAPDYPDYTRVMPKNPAERTLDCSELECKGAYIGITRAMSEGYGLARDLFDTAFAQATAVEIRDGRSPVVLTGPGTYALVMPLKVKAPKECRP